MRERERERDAIKLWDCITISSYSSSLSLYLLLSLHFCHFYRSSLIGYHSEGFGCCRRWIDCACVKNMSRLWLCVKKKCSKYALAMLLCFLVAICLFYFGHMRNADYIEVCIVICCWTNMFFCIMFCNSILKINEH